jgi:hypothetical protein
LNNNIEHMAQHLLKAVRVCKSTVLSLSSISRVFSSFRPLKERSSDPEKKKIRPEKHAQYYRMKCRTDPEWTLARRRIAREATAKYAASLTEGQYQQYILNKRETNQQRYREDPEYKLRQWLTVTIRSHAWLRERLPWKTHKPVFYEDKVQHACSTCLIPRYGGAYKLWWASHDGKHYQCNSCYFNGSDVMPKGYEDVLSMAELKKRMEELGH